MCIMKQHTLSDDWDWKNESLNNILVLKIDIESMTGKKSGF